MSVVQSFAPIAAPHARVLILGSMPGVDSLQAGQYYANPRNQFWRMMGELYQAGPDIEYLTRCEILKQADVAVWDVIKECYREGSLDSSIQNRSIEANNFLRFFEEHSRIKRIYFNGAKAAESFARVVKPALNRHELQYTRLPSTSPANASMTFEKKLEIWQIITNES